LSHTTRLCSLPDGLELFQFIAAVAAADEQQAEPREVAFWMLQEMTDTIGMHLKAQFQPIAGLFAQALVPTEDAKVKKSRSESLGATPLFLGR
jgi:hypothetical protein